LPSDRPRDRFADIIANIDAIGGFIKGMDREQFLADAKTYDATERCLSRISEAALKLGLLAEELSPNQPWSAIPGTRKLAAPRRLERDQRHDPENRR
jgi:uncharacterized protein with HEPN domain